jgi:hypothetical protein
VYEINKRRINTVHHTASMAVPSQSETVHGIGTPPLADILVSRPFRLVFNPMTKRSKRIVFADGGRIVEGNNRNEHSWRIVDGKLELLRLDGTLQSRVTFDPGNQLFQHTNDTDTVSIRGQGVGPDDGRASCCCSRGSVALSHAA